MTNSKIAALVVTIVTIGLSGCGLGVDSSSRAASAAVDREPFTGIMPKAACGPNDRVETGLQGQVPWPDRLSGRAAQGYNCNLELIGRFQSASFANMDSYHDCVYYTDNRGGAGSTTGQGGPGDGGGMVLDVSDPTHPVQTDYLTAWAMKNAGESLRANQKRGLLAANYYDQLGTAGIGSLAVYDVARDCRHPKLLADIKDMPRAVGHEGCFSPDGTVYWMSNPLDTITPIDLTDPANPRELSAPWPFGIHGCSISDDGKRGYFADVGNGAMLIVDTSEAQAHVPDAQPSVISSFPTPDGITQQGTYFLTYDGHPYVFDWSENTGIPAGGGTGYGCSNSAGTTNFPYARILDIADEKNPREVSKLKLEVHDPANCQAVAHDYGPQTQGLAQGDVFWQVLVAAVYNTHYCRPDRLHNPTIVACVHFGSGLRIIDIRDPYRPKEIAYYNTGTVDTEQGPVLDFVLSPPVLRRDLGQVWWVTLYRGFHAAQFREGVWPFPDDKACVDGYDYFADQYDPTYCRSTW